MRLWKGNMKKINNRIVVSLILLGTLIMMFVSAVIVHITHGAAVSHTWLHLHGLFALMFIIAGIYHIAYNRRALKQYLLGGK